MSDIKMSSKLKETDNSLARVISQNEQELLEEFRSLIRGRCVNLNKRLTLRILSKTKIIIYIDLQMRKTLHVQQTMLIC